jgi:ribose transport system permease protein
MTDSKQSTSEAPRSFNWRPLVTNQSSILIFVILLLAAVFSVYSGGKFWDVSVFNNILTDWGLVVLLAVGQTFVVISGGIDLSVGSTVSLSGVVAGVVMVKWMNLDLNVSDQAAVPALLLALAVCVATGIAVGLVNAFLVNVVNIVPFIATLATLTGGAGLAVIWSGGMPLQGPNFYGLVNPITFGPVSLSPLSFIVLVSAVVVLIAGLFLHRARFGLYTYAIGSNSFAAKAAGINVKRHLTWIYAVSGALSGLAGMYAYTRLGSGSPSSGAGFELQAIAAVVIGGTSLMGGSGKIIGTVLGAFLLYEVQSGLLMVGMDPNWKQVIVAIMIAGAVGVQGFNFSQRRNK